MLMDFFLDLTRVDVIFVFYFPTHNPFSSVNFQNILHVLLKMMGEKYR